MFMMHIHFKHEHFDLNEGLKHSNPIFSRFSKMETEHYSTQPRECITQARIDFTNVDVMNR